MPCYSPLRGVLVDGPQGRRFVSRMSAVGKACSLPCGRCIGCRLERARQWAVRIVHESKMHSENSFITLTYDDAHLPVSCSLSVSDCQLFFKRLRSRVAPSKVRFFLCGEYGERTSRPHYHVILFGVGFPDRVLLKGEGDLALYTSAFLTETWGLGHCSLGSVTFESASYVANYATKKVVGPSADSHYGGRKPEFLLMSRKPGIGFSWIKKFCSDVYPSDQVICRGVAARPPRFYDLYFESVNPVVYERLKVKRSLAAEVLETEVRDNLVVNVAPGRNARRLAVREAVAKAKLSLKRRNLEA